MSKDDLWYAIRVCVPCDIAICLLSVCYFCFRVGKLSFYVEDLHTSITQRAKVYQSMLYVHVKDIISTANSLIVFVLKFITTFKPKPFMYRKQGYIYTSHVHCMSIGLINRCHRKFGKHELFKVQLRATRRFFPLMV